MMKKTDDLIMEMEEILLEDYPAARSNYQNQIDSQSMGNQKDTQKSKFGKIPKFDVMEQRAPLRIQNIIEMYSRIEAMATQFSIRGNIEIDNGYSFTYQV